MGLLTAIGAIGGLVIGGPAGAKIGAGLGSAGDSLIGGSKSGKAADKATAAQIAANNQNRQLFTDAYGRSTAALNPYIERGNAASDMYAASLGLPMGGAGPAAPMAAPGNDWSAYLQQNPDVAAEYQKTNGVGLAKALGLSSDGYAGVTPEQFAEWHYRTYGQQEGRQLPSAQAQAQPQSQPAEPVLGADGVNPVSANNYGPQIDARPEMVRPDVGARPTMARPQVNPFSYTASDYKESPGFQFQLSRGVDAVASNAALAGNLKSGAATKSAMDFAQGLAYRDFANERNFAFGSYTDSRDFNNTNFNSDRAFGNNAYENDRNRSDSNYQWDAARSDQNYAGDRSYATGQFDSFYNRLGGVANTGLGATQSLVGAGNNYASALAGINSANADATGNNALYQANNSNQTWTNVGNGLGYAIGGISSGTPAQPAPANAAQSYYGQLTPSNLVPPMQRYTIPYL